MGAAAYTIFVPVTEQATFKVWGRPIYSGDLQTRDNGISVVWGGML